MSPTELLMAAEDEGFPESFLAEDVLRQYVDLLVRLVESAGAVIIFTGAVIAAARFAAAAARRRKVRDFVSIRLGLGRYLALGLEFQLASDVLSTAVAPTFEDIGKLAAVAAIRTALNYFLAKEIERERREVGDDDAVSGSPGAGTGSR